MTSNAELLSQQNLALAEEETVHGKAGSHISPEGYARLEAAIGTGRAMLAVAAEVRQTREEILNALGNWPRSQPVQVQPVQLLATNSDRAAADRTETIREARGQSSFVVMVLVGVIVLLVVLAVVLAFT